MSSNTVTFTAFLKDMFSSPLSKIQANSDATFGKINKEIDKVSTSGKHATFSIKQLDEQIDKLKESRAISIDLKYIRQANKEIKELELQRNKLEGNKTGMFNMGSIGSGLMAGFGITAGIAGAFELGKSIINVRAEREKNEAILGNIIGDSKLAKSTIDDISTLAANSPFKIKDMTDAYVQLANKGMQPTIVEMHNLGNVAASAGKSYEELFQAIGNASMGSTRALRQFGIHVEEVKSKKTGMDVLKMTFRGVTTEVNKSEDAIEKYVIGLGNAQGVSGAMEAQSNTLGGSFTKLGNAWDELLNSMGKSDGIFTSIIKGFADILTSMSKTAKSAEDFKNEGKKEEDPIFKALTESLYKKSGGNKEIFQKNLLDTINSNISLYEGLGKGIEYSMPKKFSYDSLKAGKKDNTLHTINPDTYDLEKSKSQNEGKLEYWNSKWHETTSNIDDLLKKLSGNINEGLNSGIKDVSGHESVKNIYVTVTKMVGVEKVEATTITGGEEVFGDALNKVLMTALNDANRMAE